MAQRNNAIRIKDSAEKSESKRQVKFHQNYAEDSELMSPTRTASLLGINEQTLSIWRSTGRYGLPFIKMGRLVMYRKSDVEKFVTSRVRGVA